MKHSVEKVWGKIFSEKGLPKDNKYVVAFGNSEWGESFDTKEEFVKAYRDLLYRCWFQDITGKLMVVGLCPSQVVYTEYIKYPYKNLEDSN
jgi:hypothetical protein